jgi:hypothetical protein
MYRYIVRPGRMPFTFVVIDTRTGRIVDGPFTSRDAADRRAARLEARKDNA